MANSLKLYKEKMYLTFCMCIFAMLIPMEQSSTQTGPFTRIIKIKLK